MCRCWLCNCVVPTSLFIVTIIIIVTITVVFAGRGLPVAEQQRGSVVSDVQLPELHGAGVPIRAQLDLQCQELGSKLTSLS